MDNCEYIKFEYDTSKQYPLNGFGGVIYCFTSPSNKMYIGKSKNFYRKGKGRISDYFYYGCKCQSAIYNALMKYKINVLSLKQEEKLRCRLEIARVDKTI